jgi:hypothetical protein
LSAWVSSLVQRRSGEIDRLRHPRFDLRSSLRQFFGKSSTDLLIFDPSVAATVSRDVLRRQIEEIIHGIANQERLEMAPSTKTEYRRMLTKAEAEFR